MKKNKELTIADKVKMKQMENQVKENLGLNKEQKVVVNEKSKLSSFLGVISNIISFLLKAILIIIIIFLSTIGATVLFNESLRSSLIIMLQNSF